MAVGGGTEKLFAPLHFRAKHLLQAEVGFVGGKHASAGEGVHEHWLAFIFDADHEMAGKADAPASDADPLGDQLVNEAQRDRQSLAGFEDRREVAVGRRVVIVHVAGESEVVKKKLMQMSEQRLRL